MVRRRTLWVPALLSALAVLMVLAGVAIAQLYWSDIHSTIWHAQASIVRARQSQNALLRNTQELLVAEQQRLTAQADALAAAQEELAAERVVLAREREALRARKVALQAQETSKLHQAQALLGQAQQDLGQGKPSAADAALTAARGLIKGSVAADALAEELDQARRRLKAAAPAYRNLLTTRISEVQAQAATFRGLRRPIGYYGQQWLSDAARSAVTALVAQLDRARFAVEHGDVRLYQQSVGTAKLWLATLSGADEKYEEKLMEGLAGLESARLAPDYGPVVKDLAKLEEALRRIAEGLLSSATPTISVLTNAAPCRAPAGGT